LSRNKELLTTILRTTSDITKNNKAMTEKTFKKKYKELADEYIKYAQIRDDARKQLQKIIKKCHTLENKYYKELK
jgi:DNA-binding MarR family transcriptional regulator